MTDIQLVIFDGNGILYNGDGTTAKLNRDVASMAVAVRDQGVPVAILSSDKIPPHLQEVLRPIFGNNIAEEINKYSINPEDWTMLAKAFSQNAEIKPDECVMVDDNADVLERIESTLNWHTIDGSFVGAIYHKLKGMGIDAHPRRATNRDIAD